METQSWFAKDIKPIAFLIILIGLEGYLFMVTLLSNSEATHSQALISFVSLGTAAISYYYGYSQGASKKDEALTNIANQPTVTTAETVNVNPQPNVPDKTP